MYLVITAPMVHLSGITIVCACVRRAVVCVIIGFQLIAHLTFLWARRLRTILQMACEGPIRLERSLLILPSPSPIATIRWRALLLRFTTS